MTGRVLPCTGGEQMIFDSLVLSSVARLRNCPPLRRDDSEETEPKCVKSAKIELCVISLFSLIKTLPGRKTGKRLKRSDEPVPAYERRQIIEWSDFVGPVAGCDTNFEV